MAKYMSKGYALTDFTPVNFFFNLFKVQIAFSRPPFVAPKIRKTLELFLGRQISSFMATQ